MLAAVQVGFTTTAMLAGIFSGATLAERLEELLRIVPVVATYGKPLSIVIVTIGVTYTALVIGELAPAHRPEQSGTDRDPRRPGARVRGAGGRAGDLAAQRLDPPPPPPAAPASALRTRLDRG
jgi:hypothetical protein